VTCDSERIRQLELDVARLQTQRVGDLVALKRQAKEYERRLVALNGEARRIANIQGESVSRELFDEAAKGNSEGRASAIATAHAEMAGVSAKVDELKSYVDTQVGRGLGKGELIGLIVSLFVVLSVVIAFANYAAR
jgi:hypothetical protein